MTLSKECWPPRKLLTLHEVITAASKKISRRDAELLAAHVLACDRAALLAHPEAVLSDTQTAELQALFTRRALGEPLQYLTGTQEFYGLPLLVTPAVLIPRPETEHLVEAVILWAAQQRSATLRIADVGTGSGAIAIALATHLAGAEFIGLDISRDALLVAEHNARTHHCEHRIRFVESDLLAELAIALPEPNTLLDAIVANPPYVPLADLPALAIEVSEHEPHLALFAEADGLSIYRRLIPQAFAALRPGGLLALEFGYAQREALASLLAQWTEVQFIDDLQGIPRVVLATRA